MRSDILDILEHIERERGIKKEVLFAAVESALMSAAKKLLGRHIHRESIKVTVDRNSGEIKVFANDEEISSVEFGRIAAQTAKQVIMQKIKEAERDVIFDEYKNKVGEIVDGSVHRFEKGDIIVDLGKTEAILPRKEQVFKETYNQGNRIRAYVLDVRQSPKGPQIILSRGHAGLVRKLFELEVPEIGEGIVEIKCISREPGDRTKIAVVSHEQKVDCIGACVGMRGIRVKNIVGDLHGEKVDIVRWNEDIKEFVIAALSPAVVSEVKISKDEKKVLVAVSDDQLSLAIGKKGQNVRLACKLTGWDIDIRSEKELKKPPAEHDKLLELPKVGKKTADALIDAGFDSLKTIASSKAKDLTKIPGVGKKTAESIIEAAKKLVK